MLIFKMAGLNINPIRNIKVAVCFFSTLVWPDIHRPPPPYVLLLLFLVIIRRPLLLLFVLLLVLFYKELYYGNHRSARNQLHITQM